jgi:hypothetical protein
MARCGPSSPYGPAWMTQWLRARGWAAGWRAWRTTACCRRPSWHSGGALEARGGAADRTGMLPRRPCNVPCAHSCAAWVPWGSQGAGAVGRHQQRHVRLRLQRGTALGRDIAAQETVLGAGRLHSSCSTAGPLVSSVKSLSRGPACPPAELLGVGRARPWAGRLRSCAHGGAEKELMARRLFRASARRLAPAQYSTAQARLQGVPPTCHAATRAPPPPPRRTPWPSC